MPREREAAYQRLATPLFLALVVVGSVYLAVGLFVWRLRPDRAEAWAFLLSSAFIATALFGAGTQPRRPASSIQAARCASSAEGSRAWRWSKIALGGCGGSAR